ncbi:MAG: hypothetical protein GY847_14290 [Proteobacteria bacterium]|nr:hypothetical protein [Pseudomonadota bacterium]
MNKQHHIVSIASLLAVAVIALAFGAWGVDYYHTHHGGQDIRDAWLDIGCASDGGSLHGKGFVPLQEKTDWLSFTIDGITADREYILIDEGDTTNYRHVNTGHLILASYNIQLCPDKAAGSWDASLGAVVTDSGTVDIIQTVHINGKGDCVVMDLPRWVLSVDVTGGRLAHLSSTETVSVSSPMDDIFGNAKTAAIDDIVIILDEVGNGAAMSAHGLVAYRTHAHE